MGTFLPLFQVGGGFSIKTRNGRLFRYYMMVRSLGRPRLGGKILYTEILHLCQQPTFKTVLITQLWCGVTWWLKISIQVDAEAPRTRKGTWPPPR